MKLTVDEARRMASLARLRLDDSELERATAELERIVGFFRSLREVDTTGVEPLAHVHDMNTVLREDTPSVTLERDVALAEAPLGSGPYFLFPRVLGADREGSA